MSVTIARGVLATFENVHVVPYDQLLGGHPSAIHKGGPIWPDWENQTWPRHCRRGRPVDAQPLAPTIAPHRIVRKNAFWCGPIVKHFGHAIGDFGMRILPSLAEGSDIIGVFSSGGRFQHFSYEDIPSFYRQMLTYYGLRRENTFVVKDPVIFDEINIVPQAEQIGGIGPSGDYLNMLDELFVRKVGATQKRTSTFVSRSAMRGRIAGESYLEDAMAKIGFHIFHPESASLDEQIRTYATSEVLVFSEGSAIHGTQLLGRQLGDVIVIERRGGKQLCRENLVPRSRALEYVNAVKCVISEISNGAMMSASGISVLQEDLFVEQMMICGMDIGPVWESAKFQAAQEKDIVGWIRRPIYQRTGASKEYIARKLEDAGFIRLVDLLE